jgi:hypothetical protein
MAFLPYPPNTTTEVIAVLKQDVQIAHDIVHGNITTDVDTESGLVPSFAKVVKTLTDEVNAATGVDVTLRDNLAAADSTVLIGGVSISEDLATFPTVAAMIGALTASFVGRKVQWLGYYAVSDGGSGWGVVKSGTHTADGGSIISVTPSLYVEQNLKGKSLYVKKFGVKADGVTDDLPRLRAITAYADAGQRIKLAEGATHAIGGTWVINKKLVIEGGTKEATRILALTSGTYAAAPFAAAMVIPLNTTNVPSYAGDGRRTKLSGFTIEAQSKFGSVRGLLICAPTYVYEVDTVGFSSDGLAIVAGAASPILGNANGTQVVNSNSNFNGGSGYYLLGDDANACILNGCRAFTNSQWGLYDDSLLGNTYIGCEADNNTIGGFFSVKTKPNRSVYIGCYSEGNQPDVWNLNNLNIRIGSLGEFDAKRTSEGLALFGLPSSDAYFNKALIIADTDDIANSLSGGAFTRMDSGILQVKVSSAASVFSINGLASPNYIDFTCGAVNGVRIPLTDVTGNLKAGVPYYPQGFSLGGSGRSAIMGAGATAPTTGTYDRGAIWLNDLPAAGGFVGWVCVTAGTPGTWKTYGAISA